MYIPIDIWNNIKTFIFDKHLWDNPIIKKYNKIITNIPKITYTYDYNKINICQYKKNIIFIRASFRINNRIIDEYYIENNLNMTNIFNQYNKSINPKFNENQTPIYSVHNYFAH